MQTFIDFANLSLHWFDSGLTIVSSWILLCVLAIANGIAFALGNAISIAGASGHWLMSALRWLSKPDNTITAFLAGFLIAIRALTELINSQRDSE